MKHIAIIGNGVAGITAARHIRKLDREAQITVISGETEHFFSRTALMYIYMGHMKYEHTKPYEDWFWKKNRIDLIFDWVTDIDIENKTLRLQKKNGLTFSHLILAVGSKPNKFGWPGQGLNGVQGLYSFQDLQLMEKNTKGIKRAVIVGGGLIGVEMAEMLHTRNIEVIFLVRENTFWGNVLPKEEGDLVSRHLKNEYHINLQFNEELASINEGKNGVVKSITTASGKTIECQFVGLTAGVSPNIDWLKEIAISTNKGILVNKFLETSIPNVYAIGDCAEFYEHPTGRRNIEQVWYTGKMMGETVAKTICGNKTPYNPGIWFNSAKFFDIEYQTYGWVFPQLQKGEEQFYWEAQDGKKALRVVFDASTLKLKGIKVFGIRLRHAIIDQWIKQNLTVDYFIGHFRDVNFDPEFYKDYAPQIFKKYNKQFNKTINLQKFNWKRLLQFNSK